MKGFSVIVPTLNRSDFLINTLKDLVKQKFDFPYEIIVVDQSIKEDQLAIDFASNYDFINYQYITSFRGLPEARNYGASIAKYDYLLYVDDDIECDEVLLAEHYKFLSKENVGIVAGGITEKHRENVDSQIGVFVKYKADPQRGFHVRAQKEVDHATGCNFSIKKDIFIDVGGIDTGLTKGAALHEETDLCLRVKKAGHTIFFNYDAHIYHLVADTGGCRVPDMEKYVFSLSRNRSIVINRHLPLFYRITARAYLAKLAVSYAIHYKNKAIIKAYFKGVKDSEDVKGVTSQWINNG